MYSVFTLTRQELHASNEQLTLRGRRWFLRATVARLLALALAKNYKFVKNMCTEIIGL